MCPPSPTPASPHGKITGGGGRQFTFRNPDTSLSAHIPIPARGERLPCDRLATSRPCRGHPTAKFKGRHPNARNRCGSSAIALAAFFAITALLALTLSTPASAESDGPIKIVVIAEATAVAGSSIPQAAQPVADEINAAGSVNGRKIEIVSYDDHSSAPEAVRAFQRAADRRLLGELTRGRTARRGYPRRLENNMLRT